MIAWLKGTLRSKAADRVVLDVGGVGYEVLIPFSTYYDLGNPGDLVDLHIYTHVREDALLLYGFLTSLEKRVFTMLIQVSGVGPRLAVTALSGLPVDELIRAVSQADILRLSSVPGIGKKTAERIILELKDKARTLAASEELPESAAMPSPVHEDVVSALVNLGYARNIAERAVGRVLGQGQGDAHPFEDLLRKSLKQISG